MGEEIYVIFYEDRPLRFNGKFRYYYRLADARKMVTRIRNYYTRLLHDFNPRLISIAIYRVEGRVE